MPNEPEREPTLAEMEEEVLVKGQEWMRQQLEQKLQEQADRISQSFFPPGRTAGALSKKKADAAKQRGKSGNPN